MNLWERVRTSKKIQRQIGLDQDQINFRELINELTICDTFPEGLLPDLSDL